MSRNKSLQDFSDVMQSCVKCGACQAYCPAYIATKKEGAVARAKISLAASFLDKETELDPGLLDDISMCLMCGSCVTKCPNKVPTHEIVGALRREITGQQGLSRVGKGVAAVTGSRTLMKGLSKSGSLFSPLFLKKIPQTSGLTLRFPQGTGMQGRTVPSPQFRNLFDRVPEFVEGVPGMDTVGFFAGCAISYLYPEIGEKMVRVLNGMGFSVVVPRKQQCCGIPALSSGNGKLVETLADRNVAVFAKAGVSRIVTACASCNGAIGEQYRSMEGVPASFTDLVIDFSVFVQEQGLVAELASQKKTAHPVKVTYHDPCHLKVQGITAEPRELLRALPQVEFVEMENAAACCGLGGTFSVYHYETSKKIGARKMSGLKESGAELIATGCPGCIMQLQDSINHAELSVKAVHLLDLLAEALPAPVKL